jgi:hypothetical protein
VRSGFSFDSGSNPNFLTVPQLRDLIETQVNGAAQH